MPALTKNFLSNYIYIYIYIYIYLIRQEILCEGRHKLEINPCCKSMEKIVACICKNYENTVPSITGCFEKSINIIMIYGYTIDLFVELKI